MALAPGSTSGTWNFGTLSNAGVVIEAFERCEWALPELERHHFISARQSINLELLAWSNAGTNLWKIINGTINLTYGTPTYTLPTNLVTLTDVWYTTVNGNGAGYNLDRILVPITREQYAMLPNKYQPGTPTQFWFEFLATPQITIYQPSQFTAPAYVINWFGLQQIEDSNIGGGQSPDVVPRALDALCAKLAMRLFQKFPHKIAAPLRGAKRAALKEEADEAWMLFTARDQEMGPTLIQPNVGIYGRMR